MQENKELFEVRQYFDTYLEKKWVFDTREEAEKFYELMNNKRISNLTMYQIRKVSTKLIKNMEYLRDGEQNTKINILQC